MFLKILERIIIASSRRKITRKVGTFLAIQLYKYNMMRNLVPTRYTDPHRTHVDWIEATDKKCSDCKEEKLLFEDPRRGFFGYCKNCIKQDRLKTLENMKAETYKGDEKLMWFFFRHDRRSK